MKSIVSFIALIFASLALLTCAAHQDKMSHERWEKIEGGISPEIPSSFSGTQSYGVQTSEGFVAYQRQSIGSVEIEGAYLKSIRNQKGELEFLTYKHLEYFELGQISKKLGLQKDRMEANRAQILQRFRVKHSLLRDVKLTSQPQLYLSSGLELLWKFEYSDNIDQNFAVLLTENLNLVKIQRLSSHFERDGAVGKVFPLGPINSSIREVPLKDLKGKILLENHRLKISTRSSQLARSESGQFIFDVTDERFKQVQVYFDISESMDWFSRTFGFNWTSKLLVETSIGHPEKTSAAFYYNSKISLGDGDGEVFKDMALDPSITKHESAHAVIDQVSGLVNEGESGSLNEAFADYFTATQRNQPAMGEASYLKSSEGKRNIQNQKKLQEKNGGTYHDSLIVSGLLWEFRQILGAHRADQLAWRTLQRLGPYSKFSDFNTEILSEVRNLNNDEKFFSLRVLNQRGWAN